MGDVDKDEIDLDEDDDIARSVTQSHYQFVATVLFLFSNVRRTRPTEIDDDDGDDDGEDEDRPFTLDNADEVSDDEVIETPEVGTKKTEHIRENFKVDNERGLSFFFSSLSKLSSLQK